MAKKSEKQITAGGSAAGAGNHTIVLTQTKRFGLDLGGWMSAIKSADAIDKPRRDKLVDMYRDIGLDTHVASVMEKYKASILAAPLQFQRGGKTDERIQEIIESPWFGAMLEDFIMEPWTGVGGSLFQLYRDGEWLKYFPVPHKHVDAITRTIFPKQGDQNGVSWDTFPNLLHIGDPRQIGRFAAIAYWVIVKRNNMGDWIQLAEIFGRPVADATYDTNDTEGRQKLEDDLVNRGSLTTFIHAEGTSLKFLEAQGVTGGADVFERLHVTCNSEISKMVLGNTLSTEVSDKGTQSLGNVQHDDQKDIIDRARRRLLDVLNYDLTEILQNLGFNTKGGKFLFAPKPAKNLVTDIQVDEGLLRNGIPLDDDYFYDYYGRPKPANYDELKAELAARAMPALQVNDPEDDDPEGDDPVDDDPEGEGGGNGAPKNGKPKGKTFKNRLSGFFAGAPGKGALGW